MSDQHVVRDSAAESSRESWLEWRRKGVGASDVAGIIGISPWASPWSVWADKSNLLPPEPDNEYMKAGRFLEAAIGPWFTHETGLYVAGEQTWCTHPRFPWARCTVDGFVGEAIEITTPVRAQAFDARDEVPAPTIVAGDALGVLEVKVTGPGKRWETIPEHYQAQGQWQMFVTGMEQVWFAVLHGRRLDIHELKRDEADIDFLVERADLFWTEHVLAGIAPPTDSHDATLRAISEVYSTSTPESVEVDIEAIELWGEAKADKREAEDREKRWANLIRSQLGEAEEGTFDGRRVVSWRSQTRKTTCKHCNHVTESEPFRVLRAVKPKEK